MENKKAVRRQVAAGGVVYRVGEGGLEVVVCGLDSPPLRALPKGTPAPGETREQAALREVGEETGLHVHIEDFIESIDYWFVAPEEDGVRVHKTVYFYLMAALGGDLSRHDWEFDQVVWLPAEEALKALTYPNEVRIVQKGLAMAQKKGRNG